jgi:prevent-host-death family protein
MKEISIQDLKAGLSAAVSEAAAGQTVIVTRHGEAIAQLAPVRAPWVHRGSNVGRAKLVPALKRGTGGRSLTLLNEDRGNR